VVLRVAADAPEVQAVKASCSDRGDPTSTKVHVYVNDPDTAESALSVFVQFLVGKATYSGNATYVGGQEFVVTFGPVVTSQLHGYRSDVTVIVDAQDPANNSSGEVGFQSVFGFLDCSNG